MRSIVASHSAIVIVPRRSFSSDVRRASLPRRNRKIRFFAFRRRREFGMFAVLIFRRRFTPIPIARPRSIRGVVPDLADIPSPAFQLKVFRN
jgi:hypothetical protein